MRLIAVPLARVRPGAPPVTTFLAQASKSARPVVANGAASLQKGKSADKDGGSTPSGNAAQAPAGAGASEPEKKLPLTTRMMNKASDFWIGLGREDQKSPFDWKKRTYNLGERLMDKIEYEEWALKAVDPTFGPSLNPKKLGVKEAESNDAEKASKGVEKVAGEVSSPAAALNVSWRTCAATRVGFLLISASHPAMLSGPAPVSPLDHCTHNTAVVTPEPDGRTTAAPPTATDLVRRGDALYDSLYRRARSPQSALLLPRLESMEPLERCVKHGGKSLDGQ